MTIIQPDKKIEIENSIAADKTEKSFDVNTTSQAMNVNTGNVASTPVLSQSDDGFFADLYKKSR